MSDAFRSFWRGREAGEPDTINHERADWNDHTSVSTRDQLVAHAIRQGMEPDQAKRDTDEKFAATAAERRAMQQSAPALRTSNRSSTSSSYPSYSAASPRGLPPPPSGSGRTFEDEKWETSYKNLLSKGFEVDIARSVIEDGIQREKESKAKQDQAQESGGSGSSLPRGRSQTRRQASPSPVGSMASSTRTTSSLPNRHLEYRDEFVSKGRSLNDAEEIARLLYERERRNGIVVTETQIAYRTVPAASSSGFSSSRSRSPLPSCYQNLVEDDVSEGVDRRQAETDARERFRESSLYGRHIREHGGTPVTYFNPQPRNLYSRTRVTIRDREDPYEEWE